MSSLLLGGFPSQPIPHAFTLPEDEKHAYYSWRLTSQFAGVGKEKLQELQESGWKQIEEGDEEVLLFLESHFSEVLEIAKRGTADFTSWIQKQDLEFARSYPVLIAAQVEIKNGEAVPKAAIPGSHAIVLDEDNKYHVYSVDQLGDNALKPWERIQQWHTPIPLRASANKKYIDPKRMNKQIESMWQIRARGLEAIKDLAVLYWEHHQQEQKKPAKDIPPIPMLFQNKTPAAIPNSLAIRGILSAYSNAHSGANQWTGLDEKPSYTFQHAADAAIVEWRPLEENLSTLLWHQFSQLSDRDGDVLLACLAQWMADQDEQGLAWISSERILSYRGIQSRKYVDAQGIEQPAHHRLEDLEEIQESMEHIRNTHVTLKQWVAEERAPGQRGRPKKQSRTIQSYVLTISEFEWYNKTLATAWRFRPGTCIEPFIQGNNDKIAQLFQQTLAYDSYRELWEKRLARYFMLRIDITAEETAACHIEQLFKELSLPVDARNPDRMKKRFEQALDRLAQDRIISSWRYQEEIDELPSKKWWDTWLSYHVLIEASPVIRAIEAQQKKPAIGTKSKKRRTSQA